MAKPENNAIARIHRRLSPMIYKQAMGLTSTNGTPDYYYESSQGHLWIEYKWCRSIKAINLCNRTTSPYLSALQKRWLNRAYHNNQPVLVVVCFQNGVVVLENLTWESEVTKKFLYEQLQDYAYFSHCLEEWFK